METPVHSERVGSKEATVGLVALSLTLAAVVKTFQVLRGDKPTVPENRQAWQPLEFPDQDI